MLRAGRKLQRFDLLDACTCSTSAVMRWSPRSVRCGVFDLHQRCRAVRRGLAEQLERVLVRVRAERAADHGPEALERSEAVDDRRRLVAAAHHAVGALGIAAGDAVLFPLGGLQQVP